MMRRHSQATKNEGNETLYSRSNLTRTQLAIWVGQQISLDSPHYNMAFRFRIEGQLDAARFQRAFARLVVLSPSLRTVFSDVGHVPKQQVLPQMDFELPIIDRDQITDDDFEHWVRDHAQQKFNLSKRAFDAALFVDKNNVFDWFLNQHHLITDGVSLGLIYDRMNQLYALESDGDTNANAIQSDTADRFDAAHPSIMDYATHERNVIGTKRYQRALQYWQEKSATGKKLSFFGKTTSGRHSNAMRVVVPIDDSRRNALRELSQSEGFRSFSDSLSLFQVVATLVSALVHRITGSEKIRIATPVHNRQTNSFRQTAGPLVEFYPLEIDCKTSGESFRELHSVVADANSGLLMHTCEGGGDLSGANHAEVLLNFITTQTTSFANQPTSTHWEFSQHIDPQHAMRVQCYDYQGDGRFEIAFDLNQEVFSEENSKCIPQWFLRVVDAMTSDVDQAIQSVDLLGHEERIHVSQSLQINPEDTEPTDVFTSIIRQVQQNPDSVAVQCGSHQISYRELDQQSSVFARLMQTHGVGQNDRVAICMPRSEFVMVAILAAMKLNATLILLDDSQPKRRLHNVLSDADPKIVVTDNEELSKLGYPCVSKVAGRVDVPFDGETHSFSNKTTASDPAYMIYTSGSTGMPKGVIISQQAFANYVQWAANYYGKGQKLDLPLFTNLGFDLTITSLFIPLVTGGKVVVYPPTDQATDLSVFNVIEDNLVDTIKLTPSHLELIKDRDFSKSKVRQFIVGGESLSVELASRIWERFSGRIEIHNEYGPTEATVGCIVHSFDPASDQEKHVAIGQPIKNMRAIVLNDHFEAVPQGVTGELYLAGMGLADGYWKNIDRTSNCFVPSPFDATQKLYRTGDLARIDDQGRFQCEGRRDQQVKIGGVRIELGEIESAIKSHPSIDGCAVQLKQPSKLPTASVQHCRKCGLPSNYPDALFNDDSVCDSCVAFDEYQPRANAYFRNLNDLRQLLDESKQYAKRSHDAIVLLSGGKDSTYALCQIVELGFRVLAFTLDNGYLSDEAKENIVATTEKLGVEHQFGSTPAMNQIFVDSLQRHANVCQGCFKTVYSLSLEVAQKQRIPFIVTGLSRGQLFETRLTKELFEEDSFDAERIDDIVLEARKAYHRVDDAVRQYHGKVTQDGSIFDEVRFVDFYRYCDVPLQQMLHDLQSRVGWNRPSDTGRSTNCLINDAGIFVHRRRRGFHNYALPYSWDVRLGHKTRDEALAELDDRIDVRQVQKILTEIGYTDSGSSFDRKRLIAYYSSKEKIPPQQLREYLADQIPELGIPHQFVHLDQIPLSRSGKVDRQALPTVDPVRPLDEGSYVAPRNPIEKMLAQGWSEILSIEKVGVRDRFFDLGGDSIAAIQITAFANSNGIEMSPSQLFRTLTIESLASELESSSASLANERSSKTTGDDESKPVRKKTLVGDGELSKIAKLLQQSDQSEMKP